VRRACIDIGSNTTRLLVAEVDRARLEAVHQERAFTHLAVTRRADGMISPAKLAEVAAVVARQLQTARRLGCAEVHVVATAGIRRAANGRELAVAVRDACGLEVRVLSGAEEARLAFIGAARACGAGLDGQLGVADVGGGSCELVVGRPPDQIGWSVSLALGSGELTRRHLHSDPPKDAQISRARAEVEAAMADVEPPPPAHAVAVGGSATSLARLAGETLDDDALATALGALCRAPSSTLARRLGLDRQRVRLLPAGVLILWAAAERFHLPLTVAGGGLREGVLLEAARG